MLPSPALVLHLTWVTFKLMALSPGRYHQHVEHVKRVQEIYCSLKFHPYIGAQVWILMRRISPWLVFVFAHHFLLQNVCPLSLDLRQNEWWLEQSIAGQGCDTNAGFCALFPAYVTSLLRASQVVVRVSNYSQSLTCTRSGITRSGLAFLSTSHQCYMKTKVFIPIN